MVRVFVEYAWLAVVVPAALALVVAFAGRRGVQVTRFAAWLGPIVVAVIGAAGSITSYAFTAEGGAPGGRLLAGMSVPWLADSARALYVGWGLDGLASVMLVVVGVVALMVMVFSGGYMRGESGLPRYYAVLSLFTAAMAALVLADGFLAAFVAWEVMGACSYLLIGFWFDRPSASEAATKAFMVTRIGDAALLVGIGLLWAASRGIGTGAAAFDPLGFAALAQLAEALPDGVVLAAALLVLAGAVGKSAQFPLHVWLPDAMEGPTPVSALIHAATMVAAGVFLMVRAWPLLESAETARTVTLVIGCVTALGAAAMALPQTDIKKVLAYSTISQLGFMFAALGAGSPAAATFHLVTHAAFKSLLFLAAGSVIHGAHTQDVRRMGGLMKRMPVTGATWIVGALALAGLPPLAGFFSKDAVVHAAFAAGAVPGMALLTASALTAFYVARTTTLAFFGEPRERADAHESPSMTLPLVLLALPAALAGLVGAWLLRAAGAHAEPLSAGIALVTSGVALTGLVTGWLLYRRGPLADARLASAIGSAWGGFGNGLGIDALARRTAHFALLAAHVLYERVDRRLVDTAVEGVPRVVKRLGDGVRGIHAGDGQRYSALLGLGVIAAIGIVLWAGR